MALLSKAELKGPKFAKAQRDVQLLLLESFLLLEGCMRMIEDTMSMLTG